MDAGSARGAVLAAVRAAARAALACAAVLPAAAQDPPVVTGELSVAWPDFVNHGWLPVMVDVANQTPNEVPLEVAVRGYSSQQLGAQRSIVLGPHESRRIEMVVPAFHFSHGSIEPNGWLSLDSPAGECAVGAGNFSRNADPAKPALLVVGADERTAFSLMPWVPAFGAGNAGSFWDAHLPPDCAAFVPADELPTQLESYTSIDVAIVTEPPTEPRQLEPLLAWARLGGTVAFVGPRAIAAANATGSLSPWLDGRFAMIVDGASELHALGLGRVALIEAGESDVARDVLRRTLLGSAGWIPAGSAILEDASGVGWRGESNVLAIPGVGALPMRAFALVLVLFYVLIGPLNFWWVIKRKKKPALMLITIPLLSAACTVGLLLYGIFYQGLDTKLASRSIAVLDQRTRTVDVAEQRAIFAGFSMGDGLRPAAGTIVIPHPDALLQGGGGGWFTRQDEELVLGGDFVRVRSPYELVVLSERASRLRVDVQRAGGAIEITNGLEAELSLFVLRDLAGNWYACDDAIAPGASVALVAIDDEEGLQIAYELTREGGGASNNGLHEGCYAARLERSPFLDSLGIGGSERASFHRVVGILAAEDFQ